MYVFSMLAEGTQPSEAVAVAPSANEVRSARTRAQLIDAALSALIDLGFVRTTGVEVCRRAGLTRGALNHHFPDYGDLLAAALAASYDRMLDLAPPPPGAGPIEGWVHQAHSCIARPEFKAILELWLASQNDPELGATLSGAMVRGAPMFDPLSTLADRDVVVTDEVEAVYRTIVEAFIGLGVGRSVSGGRPLGHEHAVVDVLIGLARDLDRRLDPHVSKRALTSA